MCVKREKLDPKVMIVILWWGKNNYPFVLKILIWAFYEARFLLQTIRYISINPRIFFSIAFYLIKIDRELSKHNQLISMFQMHGLKILRCGENFKFCDVSIGHWLSATNQKVYAWVAFEMKSWNAEKKLLRAP